MNEKTPQRFFEREFYKGYEANNFSSTFSVGVNCNFYFEDNKAEIMIYVTSQKLVNDIKKFYANKDEARSLADDEENIGEKFKKFIDKNGEDLKFWPL